MHGEKRGRELAEGESDGEDERRRDDDVIIVYWQLIARIMIEHPNSVKSLGFLRNP